MRIRVELRVNKGGDFAASEYTLTVQHQKWRGVVINAEYSNVPEQKGGRITLDPETARWLGAALLAVADTEPGNGSKLVMTREGE